MRQTPQHPRPRPSPPRHPRGLIWLVIALAIALAAYGALRIYMRYGGDDITVAMQMVYGMLLLIAGMAVLAFLTVAIAKLIRYLTRGSRAGILKSLDNDRDDRRR